LAKVRVHQLAKELGISNNELIALLRELGEEVKSHSSTIDEETAEAIRELVQERKGHLPRPQVVSLPRRPVSPVELAERLQLDVGVIMRHLLLSGIAVSPNQLLELEVVVNLLKQLGYEFQFERDGEKPPSEEGETTSEEASEEKTTSEEEETTLKKPFFFFGIPTACRHGDGACRPWQDDAP